MTRNLARLASTLLALALGACMVGPDFKSPAAPGDTGYGDSAMPAVIQSRSGEADQHLATGAAIASDWWRLYESTPLRAAIEHALANSPTLAAARANLAAAEENVAAARGGLYPTLDLGASAQRTQSAELHANSKFGGSQGKAAPTNLYSVGPSVGFDLDVFGGLKRQVEEQQALAENQRYELAAAYLTLTGNIVTQAITIASLGEQIHASEAVIADDRRTLSLIQQKFDAGKAARTDVLTAQSQLANDQAALPPLHQALDVARDALANLTGRSLDQWSPPEFTLQGFTLPSELPVSLPSSLVRQRPDILAAEANLHAASAAVGVATAALYPNLTLSASLGQEALTAGALFNPAGTFWALAGSIAQPLFHGGTLQAEKRGAVDQYNAALATYQQTVLDGLSQVTDILRALQHDAETLDAVHNALKTAAAALDLQRASYDAGKTDILQLVDAERIYRQALLDEARAKAQRLIDTGQLFVALGGGWWNGVI